MSERKSSGQAKGVRHEVDAGDEVQLGFPVQGQVDGGVWKFVVQADDAHGTEPGLAAFEPDVGAATIEPRKGGCSTDQLMTFVEAAETEARTKRGKPFHRVGLVDEVFKADGIIDGGSG